ncbi:homocysteine S-methyltransferase family protein [uncultured Clostridium sp.]|uniref:homocysteine S-methyltransferase family protein n=1 Tax=uncultured Clostridium sp. TaxID=59620 RepID=UPI00260A9130|nr:homocysteine S-methyltransferase family protein [uncultured Clostridium sp.]
MDVNNLLDEIIVFDGAMGTMLQKNGLKLGEFPEKLNIENKELIINIHKEYIKAGADIITTNTFGANRLKLKNQKYSVEDIIRKGIENAKEGSKNTKVKIALDIGPIGELLKPMGTLDFEEAIEIFKEQIKVGVEAGVDLILIETMTDLYEMKAAVLAAKEESNLPVFATMTFEKDGRTFTGCTPESMCLTLEGLGVDVLGVNCSLGPKELKSIIKSIVKTTNLPIMIQPNAGLPQMIDGETKFLITSDEFSNIISEYVDLGVSVIGGCCGTTPEFIEKLKKIKESKKRVIREELNIYGICSSSKAVLIENGPKVIGERINPTGKKKFKEALINRDLDYVINQALEQIDAGAEILDVNVGLPEINEKEMMEEVILELQSIIDTPLQIDSNKKEVLERGLRIYNGKPIVNSVSGEDKALNEILPLVKKYGAAVVGLTLDEKGIQSKAEDRVKIAEKIINKAIEYGIKKEDVYIDCLALTASAQQEEVMETIKGIRMIKEKFGVKTLLGVSNISFGLPNRSIINETFLAIALGAGLDLPIMNPNTAGMMGIVDSFKVLNNNDKKSENYISKYGTLKIEKKIKEKKEDVGDLEEAILKGFKRKTKDLTYTLLKEKTELEIINEYLIPTLDKVGVKYERGIIFLPQLIQAAETVKVSFEIIKERITTKEKVDVNKGTIVLATVKGDIHDIGKNIVKVILENYGYKIIDLGKDVDIEKIVTVALKEEVKLVGLSALMTTTVKSMEETIRRLKEEGYKGNIMVGGAVLTREYAMEIGATFYAKDAKESVNIARDVFK